MSDAVILDLDVARKCMLLERVGLVFDAIPMADPAKRVMLVAQGVAAASQANENVKKMVQDTGYVNDLKAHAHYRMTGVAKFPPALRSVFEPPEHINREAARV